MKSMVHPARGDGKRRAEELLKLEHTVNRCLAEAASLGAGVEAVLRALCESQGWSGGRCFLVDDEGGVLRFAHAWHNGEPAMKKFIQESRTFVFRPGEGLSGRAWESREPIW